MKQTLLLFAASIGLVISTQAQTAIPNGGFENWENLTAPSAEPLNWNSNRTGGGFGPFGPETCFRDTSTLLGGSYCIKVRTGSTVGTIVNGSAATGKIEAPTTNKADGYIHTIAGDPSNSASFTGRPDSLVFWYRFSKQGNDYPSVQARLHVGNAYTPETPSNGNHPDSAFNIISRAIWNGQTGSQSTWARVSVPFVYADSRTPQYILITMTGSGDQAGGSDSSTLWVDQMEAIYNHPSGINEMVQSGAKVFWQSNHLIVDLSDQPLAHASIQLINMSGQIVASQDLTSESVNIVSVDLATGMYIYRIISAQTTQTGRTIRQ